MLAPTRELVEQIAEPVRCFSEPRGLTHAVVIGGEDMNRWAKFRGTKPLVDPQEVDAGEHYFYLDASKAERELPWGKPIEASAPLNKAQATSTPVLP